MFVLSKPFELENSPTESPDDLIIRLTIYGFSRLYPTYQLQTLKEISKRVIFKSRIQQLLQQLSNDGEEGDKLKIFMELYEKSFCFYERRNLYPFTVVKMLKQQVQDTPGVSPDHRLHFAESFQGLSVIWFKGQTVDVQRLVIEELFEIVEGFITDEKLNNETEEGFDLRIFMELCKNVDFLTQVQFLEFVEQKRPNNLTDLWHSKLLIKPQDSHSAAQLLSRLCIFGFSLLSAADQEKKIQKISTEVDQHQGAIVEREGEESELFRMRTFTEHLNKVPVDTGVQLFRELVRHFFNQKFRHTCLPIEFLRQRKLVQNLSTTYLCGLDQPGAQKSDPKGLGQPTDNEELIPETQQPRYPEFLFGMAVLWFKTRCASSPKEPIHVLLGQVEVGNATEKLPDETEEDFRVRGFGEWFKKLPFNSQQRFVIYIRATIFHDVTNLHETSSHAYREYPFQTIYPKFSKDYRPKSSGGFISDRYDRYYPQFIKVKNPNLRVLAGGGGGATTQGGEGGGRGGGGGVTQGHTWDDWLED